MESGASAMTFLLSTSKSSVREGLLSRFVLLTENNEPPGSTSGLPGHAL